LRLNNFSVLHILNFVSQPASFWRREILNEIGYFDEGVHYAMEYDYGLRIGRRFPLERIPASLARYRIHPASKAGASANAQFDVELAIAERHTRSRILLGLHRIHRALTVAVYRRLLAAEQRAQAIPAAREAR
jgi:GT2 family glycosyltransferase